MDESMVSECSKQPDRHDKAVMFTGLEELEQSRI